MLMNLQKYRQALEDFEEKPLDDVEGVKPEPASGEAQPVVEATAEVPAITEDAPVGDVPPVEGEAPVDAVPVTGEETPAAPVEETPPVEGELPVEPTGDIGTVPVVETPPVEGTDAPVAPAPGEVVGGEPVGGLAIDGVTEVAVGDGIPAADQVVAAIGDDTAGVGESVPPAAPTDETVSVDIVEHPTDILEGLDGSDDGISEDEQMADAELDNVEDVQESLEAYTHLVRQAGLDGLSGQSAAVLHIALTNCKRRLRMENVTTGLEAYDATPRMALRKAVVSLEDIIETSKAAMNTFKEWLAKLWEAAKAKVAEMLQGITAAEVKIKMAKDIANRGNTGNKPFEVSAPGWLCADGQQVYPETAQLTAVAKFAAEIYPAQVAKYYQEIATAVGAYNIASGDSASFIELVESKAGPIDHLWEEHMVLLNNKTALPKADGHSWTMGDAEGAKANPDSLTITPRPSAQVVKTLDKLGAVLDDLKKLRGNQDKLEDAGNVVISAVMKLMLKSEQLDKNGNLDEASKREAGKVINAAYQAIRKATPGNKEIVAYCVKGVSAYVAVANQELTSSEKALSSSELVAKARASQAANAEKA
jgi:hypothetical protein